MPNRVSDAELAEIIVSNARERPTFFGSRIQRLAEDLRDARAEIARLTIERDRYKRMCEAGLAVMARPEPGDDVLDLTREYDGIDLVQSAMRAAGEEQP